MEAEDLLVVHAVGRSAVEDRTVDQDGAGGHVVGTDPQLVHQIKFPQNIAVRLLERHRRILAAGDASGFIHERAIIAVRQAFHIEADNFTGIGHHIGPVAHQRGGGTDAEILLPVMGIVRQSFFRAHRHR